MARARILKPSFFMNDVLGSLPPLARLLFQGLWTVADRDGRLKDRPVRLKAEILPYDDCDCDALLGQLDAAGFIRRYQVDGETYIQVINFLEHQAPHPKEAPSAIPAPANEPRKETASRGEKRQTAEPSGNSGTSPADPDPDPLSGSRSGEGSFAPPPARSNANARPSGYELLRRFGARRSERLGGFPWATPPSRDGKADTFADRLTEAEIGDIDATMDLAFELIRTRGPGWDDDRLSKSPAFAFGTWMSEFSALRESLHGRVPKVAPIAAARGSPRLERPLYTPGNDPP